ncbi:MAG: RecT family recombinase [Methanosarcinaceae archaeon]
MSELTAEQKMKVMDLKAEGMGHDEAIALVLGGLESPTNNTSTNDTEGDPATTDRQECVSAESQSNTDVSTSNKSIVPTAVNYTRDQIETIKNTVAKGISDSELQMFMHISQTYGLDPFLKEIFYSPQLKTIITSRDGYLKVAQRDPNFDGIQSMAVCENDDFEIDVANHTVKHKFGKGDRGEVIGAWAIVYKNGCKPVISYADYKEYNKNNNIWKTYRSAMCCKVAEVFALKRQFGISGLVTQEELGVE